MIVDTSAIIAVMRDEPEAAEFADLMLAAESVRISAGTMLELRIVATRCGEGAILDQLLALFGAETVPVDGDQVELASDGFRRFGKGRHAAGLNYGDCFAYGLARCANEALLFKGNDFALTDVVSARASIG